MTPLDKFFRCDIILYMEAQKLKSVRLTSDDYHALGTLVLFEIDFWKDKDSQKISYLKEVKQKLEEHFYEAYIEENKEDDDNE